MGTVAELPRRLREAVTREMQGERIQWVGRPNARHTFLATLPIWLIGIPWTAFSLGWEYIALAGWISGKPAPSDTHTLMGIVFPLFGLPFVLIGFAMLGAPFWAYRRARRTVHVVAEHRLVTLTVGRTTHCKSFPLSGLVRTERHERRSGWGTLKVVTGFRRDSGGDKVEDTVMLWGIPDVRKVERLLTASISPGR